MLASISGLELKVISLSAVPERYYHDVGSPSLSFSSLVTVLLLVMQKACIYLIAFPVPQNLFGDNIQH